MYLSLSKKNFIFALIILIILIPASVMLFNSKHESVVIYVNDFVYQDYLDFLDGRDVLAINDFTGKGARRTLVDMVIAQQALKLGGFEHEFTFTSSHVLYRNTHSLKVGSTLMNFDSFWLYDTKDIADHIYISDAVIKNGEYFAGIYTSENNTEVLNITDISDFKNLTAVSTPTWGTDWNTLTQLGLKKIVVENIWLNMVKKVHFQQVDFMMMPLNSTPDKSFTIAKIKLVPVKNIALALKDSRHFLISKQHPLGKEAYLAMQKGLKILRERGFITQAYTDAKFFIDKEKFKIINE